MNTNAKLISVTRTERIALITGLLAAALLAPVSIRTEWLSSTLQSLVLFSVAAIAGERVGVLVAIGYLLMGAVGLPVFAGFRGGFEHLTGPTAGFLWAFPLVAWYVGWQCRTGSQDFFHFMLYFFRAHVLLLIIGLVSLYFLLEGVKIWPTTVRLLPGLLLKTIIGGLLSFFVKERLPSDETGA